MIKQNHNTGRKSSHKTTERVIDERLSAAVKLGYLTCAVRTPTNSSSIIAAERSEQKCSSVAGGTNSNSRKSDLVKHCEQHNACPYEYQIYEVNAANYPNARMHYDGKTGNLQVVSGEHDVVYEIVNLKDAEYRGVNVFDKASPLSLRYVDQTSGDLKMVTVSRTVTPTLDCLFKMVNDNKAWSRLPALSRYITILDRMCWFSNVVRVYRASKYADVSLTFHVDPTRVNSAGCMSTTFDDVVKHIKRGDVVTERHNGMLCEITVLGVSQTGISFGLRNISNAWI